MSHAGGAAGLRALAVGGISPALAAAGAGFGHTALAGLPSPRGPGENGLQSLWLSRSLCQVRSCGEWNLWCPYFLLPRRNFLARQSPEVVNWWVAFGLDPGRKQC